MVTTLDANGRVLIPEEWRRLLGLTPKTQLVISKEHNKIVIEPLSNESDFVVEKDGVLVYTGKFEGDFDNLISEDRTERINSIYQA